MERREFILLGGGAAAGLAALLKTSGCAEAPKAGAKRRNILFICSDQHHAGVAGYAGHPMVRTPHLDRLARSGAVFTHCYSNSPVCVPEELVERIKSVAA